MKTNIDGYDLFLATAALGGAILDSWLLFVIELFLLWLLQIEKRLSTPTKPKHE